jgi:hypothetical protein
MSDTTNIERCYMCDLPATTVEHVPPKCLFPKAKDMPGIDLRKNLVTVPSCTFHNCGKSDDDEFLMVSIAGVLGNNSIGYRHAHGPVARAVRRSSYKLLSKAFKNQKHYRIKADENDFIDCIFGTPDHDRLLGCFDRIALGIYRHHFGSCFNGTIRSRLGFLHKKHKDDRTFDEFVKHRVEVDLRCATQHGINPKVFSYQVTEPDQFGIFMIRMRFYEGVEVYSAYLPNGTQVPYLLGFELIKKGMKSFINLEDKTYEFN